MAAPNIVNVTTITGRTVANTPPVTTSITLLNNPANSGQVFKINNVTVSNPDATIPYGAGVFYVSNTNLSFALANNITVPGGSTLVALDKSTSIYLEEGTSINISSNAANKLAFVCSFEIIS